MKLRMWFALACSFAAVCCSNVAPKADADAHTVTTPPHGDASDAAATQAPDEGSACEARYGRALRAEPVERAAAPIAAPELSDMTGKPCAVCQILGGETGDFIPDGSGGPAPPRTCPAAAGPTETSTDGGLNGVDAGAEALEGAAFVERTIEATAAWVNLREGHQIEGLSRNVTGFETETNVALSVEITGIYPSQPDTGAVFTDPAQELLCNAPLLSARVTLHTFDGAVFGTFEHARVAVLGEDEAELRAAADLTDFRGGLDLALNPGDTVQAGLVMYYRGGQARGRLTFAVGLAQPVANPQLQDPVAAYAPISLMFPDEACHRQRFEGSDDALPRFPEDVESVPSRTRFMLDAQLAWLNPDGTFEVTPRLDVWNGRDVNQVETTWGASTTVTVSHEPPRTLCSGRKHDYYGAPLPQHDWVVDVPVRFAIEDGSLAFTVPVSARLDEETEVAVFMYRSEYLPRAEFAERFGIVPTGSCAYLSVALGASQGSITVQSGDCDAQCLLLDNPVQTQTWNWFTGNPAEPGEAP